MAAILGDGELTLSGDVGGSLFGDGFTHADVVVALAQVDDESPLNVRLNSGGGIASEGIAIHAALERRTGATNVIVEGIAASAASLIAMAGDTVTMSSGAMMMIHDPANITFGDVAAHMKTVEELEAYGASYARVYAQKSGKSAEECRQIMREETWFTADEAVDADFADIATDTDTKAVAAFDYRAYAKAPQKFVAMASKRKWSLSEAVAKANGTAVPSTRQHKENPMTDKERADKLAAELAELQVQAKADADARAELEAEKAETERKAEIMGLDEAKGHEVLAKSLADGGMTVAAAKAALATQVPPVDPNADRQTEPVNYDAANIAGVARSANLEPPKHTSLLTMAQARYGKTNQGA